MRDITNQNFDNKSYDSPKEEGEGISIIWIIVILILLIVAGVVIVNFFNAKNSVDDDPQETEQTQETENQDEDTADDETSDTDTEADAGEDSDDKDKVDIEPAVGEAVINLREENGANTQAFKFVLPDDEGIMSGVLDNPDYSGGNKTMLLIEGEDFDLLFYTVEELEPLSVNGAYNFYSLPLTSSFGGVFAVEYNKLDAPYESEYKRNFWFADSFGEAGSEVCNEFEEGVLDEGYDACATGGVFENLKFVCITDAQETTDKCDDIINTIEVEELL